MGVEHQPDKKTQEMLRVCFAQYVCAYCLIDSKEPYQLYWYIYIIYIYVYSHTCTGFLCCILFILDTHTPNAYGIECSLQTIEFVCCFHCLVRAGRAVIFPVMGSN